MELTTMSVVGVEALLRWGRGRVLVTLTRSCTWRADGSDASIGRWVIDEALGLAALQSMEGWAELGMSVNVSARQLLDPGFTDAVGSALRASGVPPGSVAIELTETALVRDGVQAAAVLESLRSMGVVVAIDDFGTGYSSLTYLHALPVDVVKLDRSFVIGASTDPQKGAIVEAVVNLTAALGLAAVAEGIESDEHIEMLRGLGCVFGQGNHIRRPMSATELTEYLGSARGPLAQL
ncbi:MAG: EAL domain-containing protein [Microthrixaceae bacterium]